LREDFSWRGPLRGPVARYLREFCGLCVFVVVFFVFFVAARPLDI